MEDRFSELHFWGLFELHLGMVSTMLFGSDLGHFGGHFPSLSG